MVAKVIEFDTKRMVVRGREPSGCSERRELHNIFKLPTHIGEEYFKPKFLEAHNEP